MSHEAYTKIKAAQSDPVHVTREEFYRYLRVQNGGAWNMLSCEAQQASGMKEDKYLTCISFYSELKELHGELDSKQVIRGNPYKEEA